MREVKNCNEKSLIKVMPNVTAKFTRNCKLIGNICHNTTELRKPISINSVFYQGSMKVYNFTNSAECKSLKKSRKINDFINMILAFNGLRTCDDYKLGVRCYNSTILTVVNSMRSLEMISMMAKSGDIFRVVDNISFENGGKSCMTLKFEVMRTDG